jgi:hypothetical protein
MTSQVPFKPLSRFALEVINQLWCHGPVWDGYLLSKTGRDELVDAGLCDRAEGFNFLNKDGVRVMAAIPKNVANKSR